MDDYIIVGVIVVIIGLASWYLICQKKKGKKCVGCPYACNCDKGSCGK